MDASQPTFESVLGAWSSTLLIKKAQRCSWAFCRVGDRLIAIKNTQTAAIRSDRTTL
jgi:hypothetical protein